MTRIVSRTFAIVKGFFLAILFVTLWVWLASSVRRFDALMGFGLPPWLHPVGWVLAIAGGMLAVCCVTVFAVQGRGTPAPFDPPQVFVATGPYRYVRNPMYLGGVLCLMGSGLVACSVSILLLALVFWGVAQVFVMVYEEPMLERQFGKEYVQYRQRVKRWIPCRPRE